MPESLLCGRWLLARCARKRQAEQAEDNGTSEPEMFSGPNVHAIRVKNATIRPFASSASGWQRLSHFEAAKIAPEIAFRNTAGIVLPLIAGALMGYPSAGAAGALGALNVSYSDSRDPYFSRGSRMLLSSLLVAAAVLAGSLSGHTKVTTVLVAAAWAFAAGMLAALGTRAADLGTITLVTLVVFAARPLSFHDAVASRLNALSGGLLQSVLSVAVWPLEPYRPERHIVAELYRTLSTLASTPAGPEAAPPGTSQLIGTETALASLSQDHNAEGERYVFLLSQAERIRLSLLTLRRLDRRIARDEQGADTSAAIERILATAALALESVSGSVIQGRPIGAARPLTEAARQFQEQHQEGSTPFLAALIRDAGHQIDALSSRTSYAPPPAFLRQRHAPRIETTLAPALHRMARPPLRQSPPSNPPPSATPSASLSCLGAGEALGLALGLDRRLTGFP